MRLLSLFVIVFIHLQCGSADETEDYFFEVFENETQLISLTVNGVVDVENNEKYLKWDNADVSALQKLAGTDNYCNSVFRSGNGTDQRAIVFEKNASVDEVKMVNMEVVVFNCMKLNKNSLPLLNIEKLFVRKDPTKEKHGAFIMISHNRLPCLSPYICLQILKYVSN